MAEKAKVAAAVGEDGELKTKKVKITKFHPLVAHDIGETPIMEEGFAEIMIEKGYAEEVK